MKELFVSIGEVWEQYIWHPIATFTFWDFIDILILTVVLYGVYLFFKGRRAGKLAAGLVFILAFYVISDLAGLRAIHQLMTAIAPFGIILLAVIFQPELRDALEKLGSTPFGFLSGSNQNNNRADLAHTVSEVVEAACQIALSEKDGALIVIERSTPLGDYADKGQPLDATVTGNLLRNIFVDRSPLHDGAVIIRNNRIAAAGSKLPLTVNEEVVRGMGTRHRAAVGITEVSDCVVVAVSEEKHIVSIANNGFIKRDYNKSAADFQNEATMKSVQNALRKDLFRLLAGASIDEEDRADERRNFKLNFIFKWSFKGQTPKADRTKDKNTAYKIHKKPKSMPAPTETVPANTESDGSVSVEPPSENG